MASQNERTKITPPQLAREWGVSNDKVLAWIRSGELRAMNAATQPGGKPRYLIARGDVEAFERARAVVPPRPPAPRVRPRQSAVREFV